MNCVPETSIMREWDSNKPLVSIVSVAYNHGMYIEEAINGFLAQKSTYPFEIVIYDDASTDNTQQIIVTYYKQYPSIIKPILQEENQWLGKGINGTIKFAYPATRGKYIALCEGDDYWTDPYKLQKQVDFLEQNEDFAICFHRVEKLRHGILLEDSYLEVPGIETTIAHLAHGNYIHTPSCVFRNNLDKNIVGNHCNDAPAGDYYLHMMNAQFGKIFYMEESMAVYRLHDSSFWSSKSGIALIHQWIFTLRAIILDLSPKFSEARAVLIKKIFKYLNLLYSEGAMDIHEQSVFLSKLSNIKEYNDYVVVLNYTHNKLKANTNSLYYNIRNIIKIWINLLNVFLKRLFLLNWNYKKALR